MMNSSSQLLVPATPCRWNLSHPSLPTTQASVFPLYSGNRLFALMLHLLTINNFFNSPHPQTTVFLLILTRRTQFPY